MDDRESRVERDGAARIKKCPRCGGEFECKTGGCWCTNVRVPTAVLEAMRREYTNCLCAKCLGELVAKWDAEQAVGGAGKTPVVMSWSGGKDSAVALYELLKSGEYEVVSLLTTVSEEYKRISHHGVREELLEAQARAIGIELDKVYLPSNNGQPCSNEVYAGIMGDVMQKYKRRGVLTVGFGDLFLEDLRAWRENNLAKVGMKAVFPLWKKESGAFAREVIGLGFKAYLSCVEGKVGPGFAGRLYDLELLKDLPAGIDPCGENGEFHSFVWDGPIFRKAVGVKVGEMVMQDGRYYAELVPIAEIEAEEFAAVEMPPVR